MKGIDQPLDGPELVDFAYFSGVEVCEEALEQHRHKYLHQTYRKTDREMDREMDRDTERRATRQFANKPQPLLVPASTSFVGP